MRTKENRHGMARTAHISIDQSFQILISSTVGSPDQLI
jgi:hypothetical protein